MIAVVLYIALVTITTGLPLAHWAHIPPYKAWRNR